MHGFHVHVHVLDRSMDIICKQDVSGIIVETEGHVSSAKSWPDAIQRARANAAEFLIRNRAEQSSWGIQAQVGAITVSYGAVPPVAAIPPGRQPLPREDSVSRIRSEYREGDGPRKALDNMAKVFQVVLHSRRKAA